MREELATDWKDDKKPNPDEHLIALLDARKYSDQNPPEKPDPVFELSGKVIATSGNLVTISAQAKAGKSALLAGFIASLVRSDTPRDCLGVSGYNKGGRAVIHLDTEQSRYDHYQIIQTALKRAGISVAPIWLRSYSLADVSTADRRKALAAELVRAAEAEGGICTVFVDGVADLCLDPNDSAESFALVEELHSLAIKHDCPIILILHENPGAHESGSGKTRGHLGSQLERKSETNLRLAKDAAGITTVFTERARHCHIPKEQGPRFEWSDEKGVHVSVAPSAAYAALKAKQEALEEAQVIFRGSVGGLKYSEVIRKIREEKDMQKSGAEKKLKKWAALNVVYKNEEGTWFLS